MNKPWVTLTHSIQILLLIFKNVLINHWIDETPARKPQLHLWGAPWPLNFHIHGPFYICFCQNNTYHNYCEGICWICIPNRQHIWIYDHSWWSVPRILPLLITSKAEIWIQLEGVFYILPLCFTVVTKLWNLSRSIMFSSMS